MSAERATYLDSSAIVKLAVAEPESAALRRYLRRRRSLVSSHERGRCCAIGPTRIGSRAERQHSVSRRLLTTGWAELYRSGVAERIVDEQLEVLDQALASEQEPSL